MHAFPKGCDCMRQKKRESMFYLAILMPALLLLGIFFVIPVVQSLLLSFTDSYGMRSTYDWIGLSNYVEALGDSSFRDTIQITFAYTIVTVLGSNLLALVFALILDGPIRCRNLLRAVFFIPNIMSILVVGYIWRFVYTSALPDLMTAIGQKTVAVLGKPQSCRFVKHIGQGRRREPLWEQPNEEDAWDGSCSDFGGQLAAHQSRRGNRNDACRRSAFGPLYDYVPPFRCAWAYRGG